MNFRNYSLQLKLILSLFVFTAAMTAVVTYLEMSRKYEEGIDELRKTFIRLRDNHISTLAENIWRFDENSIRIQMQSMLNDKSIICIEVKDDIGGYRKVGSIKTEGEKIKKKYDIRYKNRGNKEEKIGKFIIYGTDEYLRRNIISQLPFVILGELAKTLTASIFLFFLFYQFFGRHLKRITDFTDNISLQNLKQSLRLTRYGKNRKADELDKLTDAINQMINRINQDIEEIKKADTVIETKNKELEQILYIASHDLRSPLVNVEGYGRELEYLVEEIERNLTGKISDEKFKFDLKEKMPEITNALKYIRLSTQHMDSLLKGVQKLLRLGKTEMDIKKVDMNRLIDEVKGNFEFQLKSTEATMIIETLPDCEGDYSQIIQIFSNLISNALKYSAKSRKLYIKITGMEENNKSYYYVEDNGIGIADAHQKYIFELFHRLNPDSSEGDGLGLTIVKQILLRLNGDIKLESKINEGSKFIVILPSN